MTIQSLVHAEYAGVPLIDCDERYDDRAMAGRRLAALLQPYRGGRAVVLALPPGGVAVGGEVARALRLPLDVLVAREFAVRPYPALAAGALCEGGGLCLNAALLRLPGVAFDMIWDEARRTQRELAALIETYRHGRSLPLLGRRPAILVDDGLGSGLLQMAALAALRHAHPQRCIVATPGGTPTALERVACWADEVVALTRDAGKRQQRPTHWRHPLGDDDAALLLQRWPHLDASV